MTPGTKVIHVLLVDDERDFLDSMQRALSRRDFHVACVDSGEAALGALQAIRADVVVMDVKMPGIGGVNAFREIRDRWPGVQVVMLTGHGTAAEAFATAKEGVFEYLAKPCDVDSLVSVIREAVAVAPQIPTGPDPETRLRLLLVDDETEFLKSLVRPLARRGIEVATASGATEALDLLRRRSFPVAVLDVRMPGMNGVELLREIRRIDPLTEVILLTGHPTVDLAVAGMRGGAFDYLVKPAEFERLVERIEAAWQQHCARADAVRAGAVSEILERFPQ